MVSVTCMLAMFDGSCLVSVADEPPKNPWSVRPDTWLHVSRWTEKLESLNPSAHMTPRFANAGVVDFDPRS